MSKIVGKGECRSCPMRHLSIFAELPEARLDALRFRTTVLTYRPGETIYYQGDRSEAAYTLRRGLVKLTKMLPNGRTQITQVLRTGDLFGWDGFAELAYNHNAVAITDVEVCRLPIRELDALRYEDRAVDRAILRRWVKSLRESEDMMLELGAKKAAERLASFLLDWWENAPDRDEEGVPLPLSRTEIGELLGLTIETVSRFLSDWRKSGFISEKGHKLRILDPEGLKKRACGSGVC